MNISLLYVSKHEIPTLSIIVYVYVLSVKNNTANALSINYD